MLRPVFVAATAALLASAASAVAADPSCLITFRIGTATQLASASVFAIYQNAPGEFKGAANEVDCDPLNSTIVSVGDADQTRTLVVSAAGTPTPIKGPKDFLRCTWLPTSRFPVAGDFNLNQQSGFSTNFQPVDAQITISGIQCSGSVSTTTTTTTTTTLPAVVCGDYNGNGIMQIADALGVLRTAVGLVQCPSCVCDIDGNGNNSIADALLALRLAVGLNVSTNCSPC
jgi:hypothetical protein